MVFRDTINEPFPPFYSALVRLVTKLADLEILLVLQAAVSIYVLVIALRRFSGFVPAAILAAVTGLMVVTQLPWLLSWVTPDFLGGVGMLALMTVTLAPSRSAGIHDWLLGLIALYSALVSTANLMIMLPVGAILLMFRKYFGLSPIGRATLAKAIGFTISAVLIPVAFNAAVNHRPKLAMGSSARLFNKLADYDLAQRYLHSRCRTWFSPACDFLPQLDRLQEREEFLWGRDRQPAIADQSGAWKDPGGVYDSLSRSIIAAYPREALSIALRDIRTLAGETTLGSSGREIVPHSDPDDPVHWRIAERYPQLLPGFLNARQQTGELLRSFPRDAYEVSVLLGYAGVLIFCAIAWVRGDRLLAALCLSTIIALLWSVTVHGSLSLPVARYQVKMSWLGWFVIAVGLLRSGPWRESSPPVGQGRSGGA